MSTQTSIKRIALVAAAALAIGGFSAVSANAASTQDAGTAAAIYQDSTSGDGGIGGVAGPANSIVVNIQAAIDTPTAAAHQYGEYVTVSGAGATITAAYETTTVQSVETKTVVAGSLTSTAVIAANGLSAVLPGGTLTERALRINTPTAGTVTVNVYNATASGANPSSYDSVADATKSFTISTTAVAGTLVPALSTIYDTSSAVSGVTSSTQATAVISGATALATAGSWRLRYDLSLVDANGGAVSTGAVVASVDNHALVSTTATSGSQARSATASVGATPTFFVYGDGTSGNATITFTVGTTVVGTSVVSFYSTTVASLSAVTYHNVPLATTTGAGFTATANNVYVVAKDSSGNGIPSAPTGLTVTTSNSSVATAAVGSYSANAGGTGVGGTLININPVAEGTVTVTVTDSTGLISASTTVLVTTDIAATVTTSSDATSYDPGTAVKYSINANDAKGNPIADGTYVAFLGTVPSTNVATQGFSESTTVTFLNGASTATFYAPIQGGNVLVTGGVLGTSAALATALQGANLADATFAVNGTADASAATDAANAATDAANAAADAADNATQAASEALAAVNSLATTVASLIAGIKAQITSLTNLITKIKNKVGA